MENAETERENWVNEGGRAKKHKLNYLKAKLYHVLKNGY